MLYRDRHAAGRIVAKELERFAQQDEVLVLGLPRGGVPVAYEVARELRAPLDVFVVRKLGVPGHEEMAMGAIATGGVRVLEREVVDSLHIPVSAIEAATVRERRELERRERVYRDGRPAPEVQGRTVILVDDGLATGATMRAAVRALKLRSPELVVAAVPVGSREACALLDAEADFVVCAAQPEPFHAVGVWYEDFRATTDDEVRELLARAQREQAAQALAERRTDERS